MRKPLRILNEAPNFFGLGVIDLVLIGWTLVISHALLSPFDLGLLAILLTAFLFFFLTAIRLRYRRKIIRDSVRMILSRRFS